MGQGPAIPGRTEVRCFVSHRCRTPKGEDHPHHAFIDQLREIFQDFGIEVIKDPFEPGQEVGVRIETVEYDAFLFLSCEETKTSEPCQHEKKDAKRRGAPIFLVRWSGEVPEEDRERIYVDWVGENGAAMDGRLRELAAEIAVRGRLHRWVDAIAKPGVSAREQRGLAMAIYDEADRTAVAEILSHLDDVYYGVSDPTARCWIAMAVGETDHSRASVILRRWLAKETHPLPKDGIREALRVCPVPPMEGKEPSHPREDFWYDVFLSHSSGDKAIVCPLAERLRTDGLRVWFDEWEIQAGDSIPAKIEEGLEHSRVLVLCMSANAFGADWPQLEYGTFRFRDPLNKDRRFIPLRLDNAPIRGSLGQFRYINWLPANCEQEYPKILEACRLPAMPTVAGAEASIRHGEPPPAPMTIPCRNDRWRGRLWLVVAVAAIAVALWLGVIWFEAKTSEARRVEAREAEERMKAAVKAEMDDFKKDMKTFIIEWVKQSRPVDGDK